MKKREKKEKGVACKNNNIKSQNGMTISTTDLHTVTSAPASIMTS